MKTVFSVFLYFVDYNFLEEAKNAAESAQRMRLGVCGNIRFKLPFRPQLLRKSLDSVQLDVEEGEEPFSFRLKVCCSIILRRLLSLAIKFTLLFIIIIIIASLCFDSVVVSF